ncbi:MAG: CDGSH iron-sulfur domain-containing protein [Bacteroidetes bacterium]|nr:CDGSH iron-sulfur domain-containing protein [Bacteroidota bacterium]
MAEPLSPQKSPYGIELEPKDYWWCACGRSQNQPFCDSSHKGTEFKPVNFTIAEQKMYWLCGCKKTGNQPFCDGTHKKL